MACVVGTGGPHLTDGAPHVSRFSRHGPCAKTPHSLRRRSKIRQDSWALPQRRLKIHKDTGLVYTPKDVEGGLGSLLGQLVGKVLGFLGIEFASPPSGDRLGDPPIPIPLPTNLLWIDQIVNGNGWEDHGQFDFESKEEYRQMVFDTVQNAEGKDIVRNPQGRKALLGSGTTKKDS